MRFLLISLITIISFTIAFCNTSPTKTETKVTVAYSNSDTLRKLDTFQALPKQPKANKDTLIVDKKAAVSYTPSLKRINKLKKEMGEQDFYTAADDNMYYMSIAYDFLDSVKLPTLYTKNELYIKFIQADKVQHIIKLDTIAAPWGIFLFDPKKQPLSIDILSVSEEYKNYFQ